MKKNEIVTKNATIGSGLIADAQKQFSDEQRDRVRKFVSEIVKKREDTKIGLIRGNLLLEFLEKQMKALEKGQFSFHSWRAEIIFNDSDLNDPFSWEK